jgi:hypothetical protein
MLPIWEFQAKNGKSLINFLKNTAGTLQKKVLEQAKKIAELEEALSNSRSGIPNQNPSNAGQISLNLGSRRPSSSLSQKKVLPLRPGGGTSNYLARSGSAVNSRPNSSTSQLSGHSFTRSNSVSGTRSTPIHAPSIPKSRPRLAY